MAIGRRLQRLREEAKALGVAASDGENGVDADGVADAGAEEGTGDVEKVGAKAAGAGKKGGGRPKKDAGGGKGGSKRKMLGMSTVLFSWLERLGAEGFGWRRVVLNAEGVEDVERLMLMVQIWKEMLMMMERRKGVLYH